MSGSSADKASPYGIAMICQITAFSKYAILVPLIVCTTREYKPRNKLHAVILVNKSPYTWNPTSEKAALCTDLLIVMNYL